MVVTDIASSIYIQGIQGSNFSIQGIHVIIIEGREDLLCGNLFWVDCMY